MKSPALYDVLKRYLTLQTHTIYALPVVVLMPHSACNCRCVMCDIWKDNKNLKQLTERDVSGLMESLKAFGTKQVAMSGGEALLNANFFKLCEMLKSAGISVTLLTTGLTVKKNAADLLRWVDEVIVSLDGDEPLHDAIRDVPGVFGKLKQGVEHLKGLKSNYRITARTVIHRLNFRNWEAIITEAKIMGIDQISFLPADVSSHAFNRQMAWEEPKQHEILLAQNELPELLEIINRITYNEADFSSGFMAESPQKLMQIYQYYAAYYGLNPFPFKKCNAPWVSAVIEADGSVRPCFFYESIGNINEAPLKKILNSKKAVDFRRSLSWTMATNETCTKCVCSLNLSPLQKIA